jgi:hypothetical protein
MSAFKIKHLTCDDVYNNYQKSPNYEQHEEWGQKANLSAKSHSIIVSQT